MHGRPAALRRIAAAREQRRAVDGVESIGAAAEFAAHFDLAELLDDRIDLGAGRATRSMFSTRSREQRQRKNTGADSNMRTSSSANRRRSSLWSSSCASSAPVTVSATSCTRSPRVLDLVLGHAARARLEHGRRLRRHGQTLQQQATHVRAVGVQPQSRRQLLGALEVLAQAVVHRAADERHDALVAIRRPLRSRS